MKQNSHPIPVNPHFICSGLAIVSCVSDLELSYFTHPDQWWSLESHAEGWARWVVTVSGLGRPHGTSCMRPLPGSVWTSAGSSVQFPLHSAAPLSTVTQQQQWQWTIWAGTLTVEAPELPKHVDFSFCLHLLTTPLLPTPADFLIKSVWHVCQHTTTYFAHRSALTAIHDFSAIRYTCWYTAST